MKELIVRIPDLGGVEEATIIEISAKVGDTVGANDPILVVESDKASMEIPAGAIGKIQKILVAVGGKVKMGTEIAVLMDESASVATSTVPTTPVTEQTLSTEKKGIASSKKIQSSPIATVDVDAAKSTAVSAARALIVHAGPAVRKLAREFGIDLYVIKPSGPKQRIVKEDLHLYVKKIIAGGAAQSSFDVPPIPKIDFAEFGKVDVVDVGRIKKLTAINMHRNWVRIPHVTQFDEADISELEIFRKSQAEESKKRDLKLTVLPFIIKAVAICLQQFPQFNASLEPDGQKLVLKKYCHIGFAVDTDEGLFVPVIRDADQKTIWELAQQAKELSEKARNKKLLPNEMKGGCFTISSLGSVGGTAFTPIINAPEVAILGVSRASIKPVYIENVFQPRTLLPLALSYDHRIIDGAEAARFTTFLVGLLANAEQLK